MENVKNIYVGFEKADARGDDSINNYDAMKIFETEDDAISWRNDNNKYRMYKYCGQIRL